MRRVRTLIVLVAMVCAVFAGSTSVVTASAAATTPSAANAPVTVSGKRWTFA